MKLERTKNTIRNSIWGLVYRIATLVGPFVVKTILIKQLGSEYNGLDSFFTSVLTVLNLANLGFSSSLVFSMYGAIRDDDTDAICAMLNFFRKVYKIVGIVILCLGLAVMPFLHHMVKGELPSGINLNVAFGIYLFQTVLDYWMFAYNTALFEAYQRQDIKLKISTVRYSVQYLAQALFIIFFHDYYLYLLILPIVVFPNNIATYFIARKEFPNISCSGDIDQKLKKDIYFRVGTLFGHKVGSTVLVSTDSIIISSFLNLQILSIYSNYYYIIVAVNGLVEIVTNGAIAGIGNKLITDSKEENYRFFKFMNFAWVALIGYAAAFMLNLFQPFIGGIWLGKDFLLPNGVMYLEVLYFFSWMFRIMLLTYRDAAGLWTKDWLKPYVGMILNIVGSIALVKVTGSVIGVLIPTIIVFLFVYFPWEAWDVMKFQFEQKMWKYVLYMIKLCGIALCDIFIAWVICAIISPNNTAFSFFARFLIVLVVYPTLWFLVTQRSSEMKELLCRFKRIVKR